jgi:RNA polymerase sigma-70 factor (ECF subfamily)
MVDNETVDKAIAASSLSSAAGFSEGDDTALVQASQQGHLAAFDQLIARYHQRIYATLYHMTSSHEDADDLTQESFIRAFKGLKRFKGDASFYTWVYRIAVNLTINFLKKRSRRSYHLSLNDMDLQIEHHPDLVMFVSENTPRRDLRIQELHQKLNEAMQKLSDTHRLTVTLHDIQGMSHEEISGIMDCNVGTVRSRLFYARRQLQGLLKDYLSHT